jgi:hypothetical protein
MGPGARRISVRLFPGTGDSTPKPDDGTGKYREVQCHKMNFQNFFRTLQIIFLGDATITIQSPGIPTKSPADFFSKKFPAMKKNPEKISRKKVQTFFPA